MRLGSHCTTIGTVIHEFMHALGFWHEHQRLDRDEYIKIIVDNIVRKKGVLSNFAKVRSV